MTKKIKILLTAVLIGIAALAITGLYKFNYLANQKGYDIDGNKVGLQEIKSKLNLFKGWRSPNDLCSLAGESELTAEYLDHTRLLVACPVNDDDFTKMVEDNNGVIVLRGSDYNLISVQLFLLKMR